MRLPWGEELEELQRSWGVQTGKGPAPGSRQQPAGEMAKELMHGLWPQWKGVSWISVSWVNNQDQILKIGAVRREERGLVSSVLGQVEMSKRTCPKCPRQEDLKLGESQSQLESQMQGRRVGQV